MNKNLFKTFAIAAMAVLAGACAKENEQLAGPSNVTFEVSTPEIATKAIGDGMTATKLYYQVFDADGKVIEGLGVQNKDLVSGKTTVSFQLIKDQTYNFVFWAQTAETGYYTVTDLRTITANYEGKKSNDENFDAFFAVEKALTINGPITKTVTLKRPFAQINIATTDVLKAGETTSKVKFDGAMSAVKVKGVPTVFSPLTDGFSKSADVEFASAAIPGGDFTITGSTDTYKHMAVNYVFAPVDGTVYDVEASLKVEGKDVVVKVPSAPAKRNYRTNIYGNLLTATAYYDVVIDPGFAGKENMEMWDGSADAVTEVDGVYEIKNAAQLAWVSQQVNSGATTFSGKTVKLVDDIYLGGKSWTPIGTVVSVPSVAFYGTFDGNGKTIHDLNASDNTPNYSTAGLFGSLVSATIIDLTIENAVVKSNHYAGVICGYSEGESTIQNCKVSNATVTSTPELLGAKWDNGDKVGGIAGYIVSAEVTGCTVENAAIQGYRDLGGIVGYANTTSKVTGNALKGTVTITVDKSHNYKEYTSDAQYDANPYVGEKSAEATVSDNTGEAIILYPTAIVSTQESFNTEIVKANSTVVLAAGTYDMPSTVGDGVSIIGTDASTSVLTLNSAVAWHGVNATLKNITVKSPNTNYTGIQHATAIKYENCVIEGQPFSYAANAVFEKCTFNQTSPGAYNIWTYGSEEITFNNCVFNCAGKGVLVYKENGTVWFKATFNDCKFIASAPVAGKAAIEIDSSLNPYEVYINNCTSEGFDNGTKSGNSLWNNKRGDATNLKVVVDSVPQTLN